MGPTPAPAPAPPAGPLGGLLPLLHYNVQQLLPVLASLLWALAIAWLVWKNQRIQAKQDAEAAKAKEAALRQRLHEAEAKAQREQDADMLRKNAVLDADGNIRLQLGKFEMFVLPEMLASLQPRCGLIWLHDLEQTELDWAGQLQEEFAPSSRLGPCACLLPRAPANLVTGRFGLHYSWFDMASLPLRASEVSNLTRGCSMSEASASSSRVHFAIDRLVEGGIKPERISVGGFGQGGAMALFAGLTCKHRLASIIVFNGFMFFTANLKSIRTSWPHVEGTRIFWAHGMHDDVIEPSLQDEGVEELSLHGMRVTAEKYQVAHEKSPSMIKDAAAFFASSVLEPDPCGSPAAPDAAVSSSS